jgi:uncharacterized protein
MRVQSFRPNVVVRGCLPFEEDGWRSIRIRGIQYDLVKLCSRCTIPTVNLETGRKDSEGVR